MTIDEAIKYLSNPLSWAIGKTLEKQIADNKEATQMAIDALEKQRWIPCGERLPEVGKGVLLTTTFPTVIIGWLKSDGKWMIYENDGNSFQDYITAWMPLPEPYQEGGEQDGR